MAVVQVVVVVEVGAALSAGPGDGPCSSRGLGMRLPSRRMDASGVPLCCVLAVGLEEVACGGMRLGCPLRSALPSDRGSAGLAPPPLWPLLLLCPSSSAADGLAVSAWGFWARAG